MKDAKELIITGVILALIVISGCATKTTVAPVSNGAVNTTAAASNFNLKVGVVYPSTGSLAFYGVPSMKGMEMALKRHQDEIRR